jgi:hypothetical protein
MGGEIQPGRFIGSRNGATAATKTQSLSMLDPEDLDF